MLLPSSSECASPGCPPAQRLSWGKSVREVVKSVKAVWLGPVWGAANPQGSSCGGDLLCGFPALRATRAPARKIGHFWPRHGLSQTQAESREAGPEPKEGNGGATCYLGEEPEKQDFIGGSQRDPLAG